MRTKYYCSAKGSECASRALLFWQVDTIAVDKIAAAQLQLRLALGCFLLILIRYLFESLESLLLTQNKLGNNMPAGRH